MRVGGGIHCFGEEDKKELLCICDCILFVFVFDFVSSFVFA